MLFMVFAVIFQFLGPVILRNDYVDQDLRAFYFDPLINPISHRHSLMES